jgi:hypothetical protein
MSIVSQRQKVHSARQPILRISLLRMSSNLSSVHAEAIKATSVNSLMSLLTPTTAALALSLALITYAYLRCFKTKRSFATSVVFHCSLRGRSFRNATISFKTDIKRLANSTSSLMFSMYVNHRLYIDYSLEQMGDYVCIDHFSIAHKL